MRKSNLLNRAINVFAWMVIFVPGTLNAQEVFDLKGCILTGLERNYSIKIARNQEQQGDNNYTLGNAGYLPYISTSNRYGGALNNTNQALRDGGENNSRGIYNTSGSANVNLDLILFRGFNVKTTYEKLNQLKQMGELSTQMSMENLVAKIIDEYYLYMQQLNLNKNLVYAVELSRERVRLIDRHRHRLGGRVGGITAMDGKRFEFHRSRLRHER